MNKYDETIELMNKIVNDIRQSADDKLHDLDKERSEVIESIASKTVSLIKEASEKLNEAANNIQDEIELNSFFEKVEQKCLEAKTYALNRFEEIVPSIETKIEIIEEPSFKEIPKNEIKDSKINNMINLAVDSKENFIKFVNKPENQKKYKEAKLAILNALDKGLDLLLKALDDKK